ncbi:MAG: HYC_CC_PP family protein [Flavisolibacter sp.]
MKKALAFILLLIYLVVSTGFSLSFHYCMDRLDSSQLGSSKNDKCPKCGMHKDGHCCRDEVKIVKLETSHFASEVSMPDFSIAPIEIIHTEFLFTPFRNYTENFITVDHGPPLSDQDSYIRNRVFRI